MMSKFPRITICTILFFLLSGCFDYSELNMQKLVNGAGIDKKNNEIYVNIVCASLSGEEKREIIKTSGESFFDAVRNAASVSDKKLYWGHTAVLIFGEEALSGIDEVLDGILRARDVYSDIALVAARGASAEKLISSGETDVTENIYNMFANEENSKRFQALRIWELLRNREEFGVYIIPTADPEDGGITLSGGAVMREGKVFGYLSGEEVLLRSLVTDKGAGGYLPKLSSDKGEVSFEVLAREGKKKRTSEGCEIELKITLSPAEVKGDLGKEEMQKLGKDYIEKKLSELISRAEKENLGDILFLGKDADYTKVKISCGVRISDILGGEI